MSVVYHAELVQGSEEWAAARCGLLTASEMRLLVRLPKVETRIKKSGEPYKQREPSAAENDAERAHLYELLAQRITRYVEPSYISDSMLRGKDDEIDAVADYSEHYSLVDTVGFVTNNKWGFMIGYSPDGLIGQTGLVEAKSRNQKLQVRTILDYVSADTIDPDFMIQVQTGLMVCEDREWCDLISRCGGLPMATVRVYPDAKIQEAILSAATAFEERIKAAHDKYLAVLASKARLIPTERKIVQEMFLGAGEPHGQFLTDDELRHGIPL